MSEPKLKSDEAWIKDYERKQGAALGDPEYKLPDPKELKKS